MSKPTGRVQRHTLRWAAIVFAIAACHRGGSTVENPAPSAAVKEYKSARELITAMRDRYENNWYKSLSFTQVNRYTISGQEQKSEWVEHLQVPGKLRVDILPLAQKTGFLVLDNGRVMSFANGKRIDTRRQLQPRPLLTADVYALPVSVSLRRLDSLGVDTTKIHTEEWEKKNVYVIGAQAGDVSTTQVWIDADQLVLARFLLREARGAKNVTSDTRVTEVANISGFPIPVSFVTTREGSPPTREDYSDVKVNADIPAAYFDPARWATVKINQ